MFATIKLHLPWPYRYTVYQFTTPPESSKACGYHLQYLDMFPEPLFLSLFFPTLIPTYINICWYALPHNPPDAPLGTKVSYHEQIMKCNGFLIWDIYSHLNFSNDYELCNPVEPRTDWAHFVLRYVNACNANELDRPHRLPIFISTKSFVRDLLYTPRALTLLVFWCLL